MKNKYNKKLLACFLLVVSLSTVPNSSASFRIAGWKEISDNIAFRNGNFSSKSTEVETSNKLVGKINKFVENYNYDISKNKESCINTYNNICEEIFNYLKTIKNNRTKNRTYSLLYKRITQKRYVKTLAKVQKNVDGELKDLYMIDENKVLTNVKNKEELDDIDINNIDTDNKEYKEKVQTEVYDGKKALAKSQLDDSFSSLLESESDNNRDNSNYENNDDTSDTSYWENLHEYQENNLDVKEEAEYINLFGNPEVDILDIYPSSNSSIKYNNKFNAMQAWLKCVSEDIYGGYFTVWNKSLKNALERLSNINLTNTLSRT